jgi:DHA2 family multidrug resistance protein
MIFVALSTAALATVPKAKMTAATGLYNVVRQVFGSVGIAIAATELTSGTSRYHDELAAAMNRRVLQTSGFLQGTTAAMRRLGLDSATAAKRAYDLLDLRVTRQAAVLAYNHVFEMVTILFLASVPLVLLLRRAQRAGEEHVLAE